jgi:hypothetical protein
MSFAYDTLRLRPDGPVEAGSFGAWTFEYTVGAEGLAVGDTMEIVFFTRFSTNLWSIPQTHDPTAPGFVTVHRSDGGFVHAQVDRIPSVFRPHGVTFHIIKASVGGEDLEPGSSLIITYGDQRGGSPGAQAQFLAREVVFPVFIGTRRARERTGVRWQSFSEAMGSLAKPTLAEVSAAATFAPSLQVVGGRAAKFLVTVPSTVQVGEEVLLRVTAVDLHGNRSARFQGDLGVLLERTGTESSSLEATVLLAEGRGRTKMKVPSAGTARCVVLDSENQITGTSPPFVASESPPEKSLYWGEIHAHTILSDALGKADEHFDYAMHDACLDFAAITDHDSSLDRNPRAWDTVVAKTEEYHQPQRFVTLLGYEVWVMAKGRCSAHANVYFPGSTAPLLFRPDIQDLRKLCEEEGAIIVPHHTQYGWPNMGTNWEDLADFSPEQMPVVEIFSTHGLSEYFGCPRSVRWPVEGRSVQDGLARNYRFGLIGGSDYHECLLGHAMDIEQYPRTINNRHMQTHTGLVGAWATELSREAIFEALKRRSVYATSGPRIFLRFEVNRVPMGGEVTLESRNTPRLLSVEVYGTRRIKTVEVIRNGKVVHANAPGELDATVVFEDKDNIESGSYYYARVTQNDGEQAWSSPIWVDFE